MKAAVSYALLALALACPTFAADQVLLVIKSGRIEPLGTGDAPTLPNIKLSESANYVDPALASGLGKLGARGPMFIWSNPSTAAAGQNVGQQIWIGANPTATPAANNFIGQTIAITNENSRSLLWAQNLVVTQAAGNPDGPIVGSELDLVSINGASTNPYLYAGGYGKIGLEVYGSAGSVPLTSALSIWASSSAGANWWYDGIDVSRVLNDGIYFHLNPSGGADTATAYSDATIRDDSTSPDILKVTASHANAFDFSSARAIGTLIRGFSGTDTIMGLSNRANHNAEWQIDSGAVVSGAPQQSRLALSDQNVDRWFLLKDASNNFGVYNVAAASYAISINASTDMVSIGHGLSVSGALTLPSASVTGPELADGAAEANLGYSPANKAGDTFSGTITAPSVITTPVAFASLPGSPVPGMHAVVSDATVCRFQTAVTVGGGSTFCPVYRNGSGQWVAG